MDILAQLQALVSLINELQAKLVDAEAALSESVKTAYDKGFADGVASVPPPVTDKIFSQAEVDAMLAEAVAPLQKKIEDLEAVVASVDQKIADAIIAFKADLLVKVKDIEAIENAALEAALA